MVRYIEYKYKQKYMKDNFPNPAELLTEIKKALNKYKQEDEEYIDATLVDVFIVGSVCNGKFVPYKSDLDIIVILKNSPHESICLGFDSYLREDYQSNLISCINMPIKKVDVGVYSSKNFKSYIDDEEVYSCIFSRRMDVSTISI